MAAANKPTAVHFSLVFFVMATLILGVTTYLGWKKYYEDEAKLLAKDKEITDRGAELSTLRASTDATKNLIGSTFTNIGADAADAGTVNGDLAAAIQQYGGPEAGDSAKTTMMNLRTALDNANNEIAALQLALNDSKSQLTSLETGAKNQIDAFQESQESSEQQLQANITARREAIDEKNAEIDAIKKALNEAQVQKGQIQDQLDRYRRDTEAEIALLEQQIDFYKGQIDELTREGFEREDGHIVSVDNTTRTVWIDIGSAESLKPQISFSVFTADHRGIGRGVEDIKAKIEVTRILEPHLAEARILDEDLFRPISEGDPIYTPLWSAGRKEYFATVGRMDLDEDGKSDFDLFQEVVNTNGAEIEFYVNDEGKRMPEGAKLSARTKFLIVGDLDDPADFSGIPEQQELAEAQQAQLTALTHEARLYGVRIVGLNDFLDYIGWKPEQRLWRPGENRPYNLRQGSQSASTDETYEDRTSSGTVSEIYRRNRARQQQSSEGQTSELFRNN